MILQETLTKENFFNEMMAKYPKATTLFCNWIDAYKKAVKWGRLFHECYGGPVNGKLVAPKFHELPYAMQQGIWIEFVNQTLHQFFEQPEYQYTGDLGEDIKSVFGEIEPLIEN